MKKTASRQKKNSSASNSCKTLDLVLMHRWYDMIGDGEKPVEYRKAVPHWIKRLLLNYDRSVQEYISIDSVTAAALSKDHDAIHSGLKDGTLKFKEFQSVRFRRGYTRTTMEFKIQDITFGFGESALGAPEDERVFRIKIKPND